MNLDAILEEAPVGILVVAAPGGEIAFANEECERIAGVSLERGTPMRQWNRWKSFRPDGSPLPDVEFPISAALIEGRTSRAQEIMLEHADGTRLLVSVYATPVRDTVVAAFCDITEKKALEQTLRLSTEDLTHLAFAVAHDLQEPVRTIASYTTLLERRYGEVLGNDGRDFVGYIAGGAQRMRRLMSDLLIWSQVTTSSPQFADVEMDRVLDWALSNLRSAMDESGAAVQRQPLPLVRGDFARLAQLLQNLIANAIKYRGTAAPRVEISAEPQDGGTVFSVRDNGIGIAPESHEAIFGLFRRLHGDELPGTGVGLAVCRTIVERHGGRLWVESQLNEGAVFRFTLPRG